MKKLFHITVIALLSFFAITISSCSIQQRKYLSGVDVRWHLSNKNENVSAKKVVSTQSDEKANLLKSQNINEAKFVAADPVAEKNKMDSVKATISKKYVEKIQTFNKKIRPLPIHIPDSLFHKKKAANHTTVPPDHPLAVRCMFLAAASFGFLLIAVGLGIVFPALLVGGIILAEIAGGIAISNGKKARRDINAAPEKYSGRGLANVGFTIAWIIVGTTLVIVGIGLLLALIVIVAALA